MIVVTTDRIEGKQVVKTLGLVRGSTITKMLAESREQALQRMVEQAESMGANAIIGTRFVTSMVMSGAAELLAYGTAVETQ